MSPKKELNQPQLPNQPQQSNVLQALTQSYAELPPHLKQKLIAYDQASQGEVHQAKLRPQNEQNNPVSES